MKRLDVFPKTNSFMFWILTEGHKDIFLVLRVYKNQNSASFCHFDEQSKEESRKALRGCL